MLDDLFLRTLNMTYTGSIAILFVLAGRLLLKKAPKIYSYILWSVVLFRLLCPVTLESIFSLLPAGVPVTSEILYAQKPQVNTGLSSLDNLVNPLLPPANQFASVNPLQIVVWIGSRIWITGTVVLIIWGIVSYFLMKRKLKTAQKIQDSVYTMEGLETPFVLGVIHPRIYLPENLDEEQKNIILLHEQKHIRRLDYVVKLIAYLTVCIHWFNPLVWAAFLLAEKDMEMSCDEYVIHKLGKEAKKCYSSSLLSLAAGKKLRGVPLAFGEGDTKARIKNILKYQKPAIWGTAAAVAAVLILCTGLACNPMESMDTMLWARNLKIEDVEKIELISTPNGVNDGYQLIDTLEYPDIIQRINQSNGAYVQNPESLAGGAVSYYITTKDGIRHVVTNVANVYLMIDGDYFEAKYQWLSGWSNLRGDSPIPEDFFNMPITSDQALEQIRQTFPEQWIVEADGDQSIGGEIAARFRILSPYQKDTQPVMILGVEKSSGRLKIIETSETNEYWLYTLLSNVTVQDGMLEVNIPEKIPDGNTLYLHISGRIPMEDNSYLSIHAFEEENWIPGEKYLTPIFEGDIPNGTELYLNAGFLDQQGNFTIEESAEWIFLGGKPVITILLGQS